MAKKNKPTKKHRFKHTEPGLGSPNSGPIPAQATLEVTEAPGRQVNSAPESRPAAGFRPGTGPRPSTAIVSTVAGRDFSYVAYDLRRLGIFASGLIILELVLWYLMGHTGFGDAIYSLVRV